MEIAFFLGGFLIGGGLVEITRRIGAQSAREEQEKEDFVCFAKAVAARDSGDSLHYHLIGIHDPDCVRIAYEVYQSPRRPKR